jgi:hypothetical protein
MKTLFPEHYLLDNNQEPEIFDILEIECSEHRPDIHQPENWMIGSRRWKLIDRPCFEDLKNILGAEVNRTDRLTEIFRNRDDRIVYEEIQLQPLQSSLVYLKAENIFCQIQQSSRGKKKYRGLFMLNNICYDLSITDPQWQDKLDKLPVGNYSSIDLISQLNLTNFTPNGFCLVVSISEPFSPSFQETFCFKLITTVINVGQMM